jgi:hypothetical protein
MSTGWRTSERFPTNGHLEGSAARPSERIERTLRRARASVDRVSASPVDKERDLATLKPRTALEELGTCVRELSGRLLDGTISSEHHKCFSWAAARISAVARNILALDPMSSGIASLFSVI